MNDYRRTAFTETVLNRLKKNGETAHLWVREVDDALIISNREICIRIENFRETAKIDEQIYCDGRKRWYCINWNGDNELDLHEFYCCYKSGSFIGIWDYHYEEDEEE